MGLLSASWSSHLKVGPRVKGSLPRSVKSQNLKLNSSPQASDLPLLYWLGLISSVGEGVVVFL